MPPSILEASFHGLLVELVERVEDRVDLHRLDVAGEILVEGIAVFDGELAAARAGEIRAERGHVLGFAGVAELGHREAALGEDERPVLAGRALFLRCETAAMAVDDQRIGLGRALREDERDGDVAAAVLARDGHPLGLGGFETRLGAVAAALVGPALVDAFRTSQDAVIPALQVLSSARLLEEASNKQPGTWQHGLLA